MHIDMPHTEEKIACFYDELQATLIKWAESSKGVTYLSMEGSLKLSPPFTSVCFDLTVYADKSIVNYRRYAQVWDDVGNLLSRNAVRSAIASEKRFSRFYRADGFYVENGEERAIFNRFDPKIASGMRPSQLPELICEIRASDRN